MVDGKPTGRVKLAQGFVWPDGGVVGSEEGVGSGAGVAAEPVGLAAGDVAAEAGAAGLGGAAGFGGAGFSGLMPPSQAGPEYMSAVNPFPFHFSSKSAAALFGVSPTPKTSFQG